MEELKAHPQVPGHTEVRLCGEDAQCMSSPGGDTEECAHWVIYSGSLVSSEQPPAWSRLIL